MNEIRSKLIGPYIEDTYKTPVCLVYWYLFMLFLRRVKKVIEKTEEESNIDPKQSSVKKSFISYLYLADFLLEAKILLRNEKI